MPLNLTADPEELLRGLDPEQLEAARIVRGPLVIHAGAGSGKTRVISHRVAYAVATAAVDPRRVLVVSFTDKAAAEMADRLAALGLPGIAARTFHAAALAQLRHFWP
ncbi:MAG: UvrD-helicase domain-containing protein, partial [Candidatus Limnocylindrales bacterium]